MLMYPISLYSQLACIMCHRAVLLLVLELACSQDCILPSRHALKRFGWLFLLLFSCWSFWHFQIINAVMWMWYSLTPISKVKKQMGILSKAHPGGLAQSLYIYLSIQSSKQDFVLAPYRGVNCLLWSYGCNFCLLNSTWGLPFTSI